MSQILLLHGWGFPGAVFSSLIEELGSAFDARAIDRAGYGDNDGNGEVSTIQLHERPTLLVGWSLGGMAALQLALQQPDKISGLVLLATTPCFVNRPGWQSGMDAAVFNNFNRQVINDPAVAIQQFARMNAGDRPDRQSAKHLSDLSGRATDYALQQEMKELAELDLRDAVAEIKMPVLLLHAADDRLVPAKASSWLLRNLPNAKRHEFQTGGHAFFLQQTESVAQRIRAML